MVQRLDAIYQNGVFSPLQAVQGLTESSRVRLTIEGAESSGKALAEIAGILPDADAREIHAMIEQEFKQVEMSDASHGHSDGGTSGSSNWMSSGT